MSTVDRDITDERQLRVLLEVLGNFREDSLWLERFRQRGQQMPNIISVNRAIGNLFST
jgi:hypothetical protein